MKRIAGSIMILFMMTACSKFVEVPLPADGLSSQQVFTDDNKATSAVTSLYGSIINSSSFASYQSSLYGGLSSDELVWFNTEVNNNQINKNEIWADNASSSTIWTTAYGIVYSSNAIIEGLDASEGVSPAVRLKLKAECRTIRALCYFYLINFYGDVPFITGSDYKLNSVIPRRSSEEIYQFIIDELKEAKDQLPAQYTGPEKVRINKWAVTSLLARVYLYRSNWAGAEQQAAEVLNSGLYTPLEAPSLVFLKNSKESIWQLMPNSGSLRETTQFIALGGIPSCYIHQGLLNAFADGDIRRKAWVDSVVYQSTKYYYPGKYKNTTATIKEYYTVFRAGELFLIRAEAKAMQDKLTEAIDDINIVRQRANLAPLSATLNKAEVLLAVENERRFELFCEWGHRWFDLIRTGRAGDVIGSLKNTWQPTDKLYPVPQTERLANVFLTQNPGY